MIFVDKIEVSKTRREIWSGNGDDAVDLRLQRAKERSRWTRRIVACGNVARIGLAGFSGSERIEIRRK
jgi:hypothetical protein